MDKNEISVREAENDGKSVFLYYDELIGLYLAFGLSAYYVTLLTEPYASYSMQMNMPVVLLKREHILTLRQSLKKLEHTQKVFYRFELTAMIGDAGYAKWAEKIQKNHAGL